MERLDFPAIGETMYADTLPNGLRLRVCVKPGYTSSYAYFATNYGGADRRFALGGEYIDTPAGVAHFLEHKMFDMPEGDNALAALAANGADPNAYTSSSLTAYYFEAADNFYENLRLLLRFVSTPYFTAETVAKEQGIIGQEIRMVEDLPGAVQYWELMRCLYDHHPVRDSVVGTIGSIAEITPEILYSCHKVFYNPGNMCLCVCGDVDPERVRAAALEILPAEVGELPVRDYGGPESAEIVKPRFLRAMDVSAPQLVIGIKLPAPERGVAMLRQKVLCGLAMSYLFGESSPLYLSLYRDGLVNADFGTELDHYTGIGGSNMLIWAESRDPERVFSLVSEALERSAGGVDEDYFRRIKRAAYGGRIRGLSSFGGLCAAMAEGAFEDYNYLDAFSVTEAVTAGELRQFIKDHLVPGRMAMSVISPAAGKESKNA